MIAQGNASRFRRTSDSNILYIKINLVTGLFRSEFSLETISRRHSGKAVVLLADGHVGSEMIRQLEYPSFENWMRFN